MTPGAYLRGVLVLSGVVVPLVLAASRWRARLFPTERGTGALMIDSLFVLAGVVVISQVLGSVGLFARWPIVGASVLVGATLAVAAGRSETSQRGDEPRSDIAGIAIAALCVLVLVAVWSMGTLLVLDAGIADTDSQYYHLSHAARFVQDGWLSRLHFGSVGDATAYHPYNAELIHALGMLAFGRDILSPFINAGWLALALAAAARIGRDRRVGAWSVAAVALVLATPLMVRTQAASAQNDIASIALLLTATAVLLSDTSRQAGYSVAALAAGLGLGTKMTLVAPVAVLSIAAIVTVLRRGTKLRKAAIGWFVPLFVGGSFWYLRNLVRVGNPVPAIRLGLGDVALPRPPIGLIDRFGYSVFDYATDVDVWRAAFYPGLRAAFGAAWPVLVVIPACAFVAAIWRGSTPAVRAVGIAGMAAALAYVFTPTTALGPEGRPLLFEQNLRYLTPALALGMALAPSLWRSMSRRVSVVVAITVGVVLAFGVEIPPRWRAYATGGVLLAIGLAAVWGSAIYARRRRVPIRREVACLAVAILLALVGFGAQERYVPRRYTRVGSYDEVTARDPTAFVWAQGISGADIGIAGFFVQYPLFGRALSNSVRYVGNHRADGAFVDLTSCIRWRSALNEGEYSHVVIMPAFPNDAEPVQARWTRGDSAAREILHNDATSVFVIEGPLSVGACASAQTSPDSMAR